VQEEGDKMNAKEKSKEGDVDKEQVKQNCELVTHN
jgi:hypothetical protein